MLTLFCSHITSPLPISLHILVDGHVYFFPLATGHFLVLEIAGGRKHNAK
jgi:hypothetical protein